MLKNFTVYYEKDIESGMYIGYVPAIPGAHTEAETIDELQMRLKEVIELCLSEMDKDDSFSHGKGLNKTVAENDNQ